MTFFLICLGVFNILGLCIFFLVCLPLFGLLSRRRLRFSIYHIVFFCEEAENREQSYFETQDREERRFYDNMSVFCLTAFVI